MLFTDDIDHSAAQQPIDCSKLSLREQRIVLFHLLYAADAFEYQQTLESLADNFSRGFGYIIKPESAIFKNAIAIIAERDALDVEITPLLDNWRLDRLGVCTRIITRLGLWELKNTETDAKVIINEAVELAKGFAELDAYRFVNGILDQWVKKNRPLEHVESQEAEQEQEKKSESSDGNLDSGDSEKK